MRKLALSDDILLSVDKPARYIGGELNSRDKRLEDVDIRFVMCFPDVYEIGMSHIGMQIIYDMLNKREDIFCERLFSPWVDLDKILREKNIPLFSLESQENVKDADILGITLQYEMCYTNILQILELSQIPMYSKDRGEEYPIVIGGGPCSYNPEPLAPFFDIFYIGEGEVVYDKLLDLYKECKKNNLSKHEFLRKAAKLEGMYVPEFYEVSYKEDGTIASFTPKYEDVPSVVHRVVVQNMDTVSYLSKPVVPFIKVTQDRVVLEIMRGCIRGCRFCQAGNVYRPQREHSLEYLINYAKTMLDITGAEEISLSSLSSSDYSQLDKLLDFLLEYTKDRGINISLPSLRIDAFSLDVMSKVQDVKKSSLTFAPEAGTQRLRDVINKGITEEDILSGSMEAFKGGWNKVKLYFMLGLPTETEEDIKGIPLLCEKIAENYYSIPKDQRIGKVSITASSSFFVPKPFTPFQWAKMETEEEYLRRAHLVKDTFREQLNQKSMKYQYHDAEVTLLEGLMARGDRKIADVIVNAYKNGAMYDSWSDQFNMEYWLKAYEQTGIDPGFYTLRQRDLDEIFPWDFIDSGVTKEFLIREWKTAHEDKISPNCRQQCLGCGARKYNGGVCFEGKN
ncbi:TIGR03960 family B12-binding radical SAM protein [Lachnoanaerobaculum gingivalis]|uniref:TIGR03960 family B12-binding radical SAM protein n=1 Tax=Lachnoanaerobaculum gingivalis TaxID=2490855 RepID=A0A3P3R0I6_9FIRM|nr:TIGR03960 family B12-binding radical SAM protein [Lachnoanaerobaculum gingivalis]RRJ26103.1 TIGR03960 family B12-binding radical SAM protein [Lachnoanaerobaculum gingivalis]